MLMVFYHGFYLLGDVFGFELMTKTQQFFMPLQPPFACVFIFISGMCSYFSRSNLKRGIKLLIIAMGFTAVTVLLLPKFGITGGEIYFGVLHLLSVSMLIFAVTKPLLEKINIKAGFVIFALLFFVTYNLQSGKLFFFNLPATLYLNKLTAVFGFPPIEYYSADYFPLFPFLFMFLSGTFFGKFAAENQLPELFYKKHFPLLAAIGRKTLIIYIVHWPIIFLLGLIISKI